MSHRSGNGILVPPVVPMRLRPIFCIAMGVQLSSDNIVMFHVLQHSLNIVFPKNARRAQKCS